MPKIRRDYKMIMRLLEKNLAGSAFRRGVSAHRLGLIQEGVSDHLPIQILAKNHTGTTSLISWNLLADAHLYNNFMNISGTIQLLGTLASNNIYGGSEHSNKLYYYFSELGQFLYDNRVNDVITLDKKLLDQFNSLPKYRSKLALSRDEKTAIERSRLVREAREAIATILLDPEHRHAHEFELAIQHSVDLIYHINDDCGALKWSNRFKKLAANKVVIEKLRHTDFLCLQECTNPQDIQSLLPNKKMLLHRVNTNTSDHCVILYDSEKFEVIDEPIFCALDQGKKPCIFARFKNKETGKALIVGSVHHPGGKESHLHDIIEKINELKYSANEEIEFFVPGDYNHTGEFFGEQSHPKLFYPSRGTMAGNDYGNINQSIDALLSNVSAHQIQVERVRDLPLSAPVEMPLRVHFKDEDTYRSTASASFDLPVQNVVSMNDAENALDILGQNDATYAPRITL
jgi:hypothetical protein